MTPDELDAIEARANAATPGPWSAVRGGLDGRGPYHVSAGPFRTLATVNMHGDNPEADARLMAAAPDLLDALTAIMSNQLSGNVDLDAERFRMARAAISKAKGNLSETGSSQQPPL